MSQVHTQNYAAAFSAYLDDARALSRIITGNAQYITSEIQRYAGILNIFFAINSFYLRINHDKTLVVCEQSDDGTKEDRYAFIHSLKAYPAGLLSEIFQQASAKHQSKANYFIRDSNLTISKYDISFCLNIGSDSFLNVSRKEITYHFCVVSTETDRNKQEWGDTYQEINDRNGKHFKDVVELYLNYITAT